MILLLHVANAQVTSGMKICWPCQRKNRLLLEQGISDISDPSLPWQTVLKLYWPFTKLFSSSWHGRAQHTQQGSSYPALVAAGSRWRPSSLPTMVMQPGAEIAITCAGMQPYAAGFMNSPLRKADSVQYCLFGDLGAVSFGMRGTWHGII